METRENLDGLTGLSAVALWHRANSHPSEIVPFGRILASTSTYARDPYSRSIPGVFRPLGHQDDNVLQVVLRDGEELCPGGLALGTIQTVDALLCSGRCEVTFALSPRGQFLMLFECTNCWSVLCGKREIHLATQCKFKKRWYEAAAPDALRECRWWSGLLPNDVEVFAGFPPGAVAVGRLWPVPCVPGYMLSVIARDERGRVCQIPVSYDGRCGSGFRFPGSERYHAIGRIVDAIAIWLNASRTVKSSWRDPPRRWSVPLTDFPRKVNRERETVRAHLRFSHNKIGLVGGGLFRGPPPKPLRRKLLL